jgi:Fe-S-cluster containining protein
MVNPSFYSLATAVPLLLKFRREVGHTAGVLHDELSGSCYQLDDVGRAVVNALCVPLEPEQLIEAVTTSGGHCEANVTRELRRMVLCGLFEETCTASRAALERLVRGESPEPRTLKGTRFACQRSGACCRGYVFGYIREDERARIESLDLDKAFPHLAGARFFEPSEGDSDNTSYVLASKSEACIFLEDDRQCGLHRAFGEEAKPRFCRLYPLDAISTIEGLKVYDRGECATFAISSQSGAPLENDFSRIRGLLNERLYHPLVQLHGYWRCDYGVVLQLARRFEHEVAAQSPLEALHAIGHVARYFIVRLGACPLESGEPERTASHALACPIEELRPSSLEIESNARRGLEAMAVLLTGLAERVSATETLGRLLCDAALACAELCGAIRSGSPASERTNAAIAIAIGDDSERALTTSIQQDIFGRELLLGQSLPAGLLRMALVSVLTLVGARLRALEEGRDRVSLLNFSSAHMVAKRTLHRAEPNRLLEANGERAWSILDALSTFEVATRAALAR